VSKPAEQTNPAEDGSSAGSSVEPPEVTELFEYVLSLKESGEWEEKLDKPAIKVAILPGSRYNNSVPVMRAECEIETDVSPSELYLIVNTPELRMRWDSDNILEFRDLKNAQDVIESYTACKLPWPMKNRDFVDRRYLRRLTNGDVYMLM
jgi:hypothetical protein